MDPKIDIAALLSGAQDDDEGTTAPGTGAPATSAPGDLETDAPGTDAPATDAPGDDVSQLKQELAAMREALAKAVGKQPEQKPQTPVEPPIAEVNFLDGIEMEDLQEDPKAFNAILNKVLKEGVKLGRESVLKDIPNIITYNVRQQTALKEATDKFYNENQDLVPFKRVVGAVAEELMSEKPDLTLDELFKKAAVEARTRLALVRQTQQPATPPRKPALPQKQRGARRPPANGQLTPEEQGVLDMIKGAK